MKNFITFLCLMLAFSVVAQPLQHNRFTTNTDGAAITVTNFSITSGQETLIWGNGNNFNSLNIAADPNAHGYAAARFSFSVPPFGGFDERGAVGISSNGVFYTASPFRPGFLYLETEGDGAGFVSGGLPLAYIDPGLSQFHIATNGGTADVFFVNRQNAQGGLFGIFTATGGLGITPLNASSINSGTVPTNNLPTNLAPLAQNNGVNLTNLNISSLTVGVLPVASGGTGGSNQATAQANIESPLYVRLSAPAQSAGYSLSLALPNQGMLLEYSYDGVYWQSLLPNSDLIFTNSPGVHDPGFHIGTNGLFYFPYTSQGPGVFGTATNFGLAASPDLVNWTNVAIIPFNTNTAAGISWSPDWITVNGKDLIYGTQWNSGGFDGTMRAITALDSTYTNWTTPASAVVLITNESPYTTGSPYGQDNPLGPDGVNDPFGFNVNTNTYITNSSGGSVLLTNGTFLGIAYNWATLQYDAYTNNQSSMPIRLHLALTNITALTNSAIGGGSEAGDFLQLQNGTYRFYGTVGIGPQKGRFFYSDNTNGMIGGWTTYNLCQENPNYTFGQSTVTPLFGSNKLTLQRAIAAAQNNNVTAADPYGTAELACSIRQLPGYNGPAMDVRRSSDNAVARIGFTGAGDLDTNALQTFAGAGNAFVTCWYDQGKNHNNLVMSTNANQPQIVSNGLVLLDQTSHVMLKFGGNPVSMISSRAVNITGGYSMYSWAARPWATANYSCAVESADYAQGVGFGILYSAGTSANGWTSRSILAGGAGYLISTTKGAFAWALPVAGFINSTNNGTAWLIEANMGSTNSGIWINGTNVTTATTNSYTITCNTNIFVGGNPSGDYDDGYISEMILFPSYRTPLQQMSARQNVLNYYQSVGRATPTPLTAPYVPTSIVYTNWVDGFTNNVNNTGHTLLIFAPAFANPAAGGAGVENVVTNGVLGITAYGLGVSAASAPGITNVLCFAVTNGETFGFTNRSAGSGNAGLLAGGYYLLLP